MVRARTLAFVLMMTHGGVAFAGGFQIFEQGAAGTAQAGARAAHDDDPSAIFYNPAGIARLHGWHIDAGATLVVGGPTAGASPMAPIASTDATTQAIPIPAVFASYGFAHDLAAGVGVFTQYGLQVTWPEDWAGRGLVTHVALRTVTVQPTLAWRPAPWLAIGAGFDVTPASVDLDRSIDLAGETARAHFGANTVGYGGNAGVLLHARRASLGVSYRSRYDLDFDGGGLRIDAPLELQGTLHDARARTNVPIPDVLSVALGGGPVRGMRVTAQLDWINWSRFQDLTLTAPDMPLMSMTIPQRWNDGWTARLGAEQRVGDTSARVGVGYDWSPVPKGTLSPIVPDSDRFLISGGLATRLSRDVDGELSVMGVIFRDRHSENPALPVEYSNFAVLTTLTFSMRRR